MGISISEFRVAMQILGAKPLPNRLGTFSFIHVPCFAIGDISFSHSGTHYILVNDTPIPEEILNSAIEKLGKNHPESNTIWMGEIHSLKVLVTLGTLLTDTYSDSLVKDLSNIIYKEMLDHPLIHTSPRQCHIDYHSKKMEELKKLLTEYDSLVNPFNNGSFKLKDPIEYFDNINLSIAYREKSNPFARLTLEHDDLSQINYDYFSNGYCYNTIVLTNKNRKHGYIDMEHYYEFDISDNHLIDEIVCLDYKCDRESYSFNPNDIKLRVSIKTGLTWPALKKELAAPVSDSQIDIIISFLKETIKRIKKDIIKYIQK